MGGTGEDVTTHVTQIKWASHRRPPISSDIPGPTSYLHTPSPFLPRALCSLSIPCEDRGRMGSWAVTVQECQDCQQPPGAGGGEVENSRWWVLCTRLKTVDASGSCRDWVTWCRSDSVIRSVPYRLTVGTILEGRIEWAESKVTLSYSIRWDCVRSLETVQ